MVFSRLCYDRMEGVASRRSVRKLATNRSISKDDSRSGKNGDYRSGKPGYSKYLCFAILHSSSSKYQTINVNWTRPRVAAFFLLLNHRPYSSFSLFARWYRPPTMKELLDEEKKTKKRTNREMKRVEILLRISIHCRRPSVDDRWPAHFPDILKVVRVIIIVIVISILIMGRWIALVDRSAGKSGNRSRSRF